MKDSVFGNGLWSILVNVCHQEICLPVSKGETFKFQMLINVKKIWYNVSTSFEFHFLIIGIRNTLFNLQG